ncbi:unnamed protein product [Candidula unifasciata]|uniref:Uncharacterized protein n=1 Tax=Candidula unifasciata TaxID=100452 RepID=A0A8S3ZRI8_9EUPU|nr:unnamed protein product [Candidula unifasciata]
MTESSSWAGSRCGGDSTHSLNLGSLTRASSQNSELAKQVYEQSRVKGILLYMMGPCGPGATLPKSESDEFSDLASDLDFDELASECCKLEGVSSADESTRDARTASVSSKTENKQQNHKPALPGRPQGHSFVVSGDKGDFRCNNTQTDILGVHNGSRTKSCFYDARSNTEASDQTMTFTNQQRAGCLPSQLEYTNKPVSLQNLDIISENDIPFTGNPNLQKHLDNVLIPPQLLNPHKDEVHSSMASTDVATNPASTVLCSRNESYHSVNEGITCSDSASQVESMDFLPTGTMTHSAPVMDLASLASDATRGPHHLSSVNMLHSNTLSHSTNYITEEPLSSESEDDIDSGSTLSTSQACNDSSTSTTEDMNETEQAVPAVKPADFQSIKRQKMRPPAIDWSPVIDLSPIQDVSPSVEEAEQEDMLAKQLEELHRQRLRNLSAEIIDLDSNESENLQDNNLTDFKTLKLTNTFPSQLLQHALSPTNRFQEEEHTDDDEKNNQNEAELPDGNSPFIGTLKRCNNCEDISKLDSDSPYADHVCDLDNLGQLEDDNVISDISFYSCTTQPQILPPYSTHISVSSSAFEALSNSLQENMEYEQGTKQIKYLENFITDEIHKITEDMENIVQQDYLEEKPIPPPKPRRKLPDPEFMGSPSEDKFVSEGIENILSFRIKPCELSEKMESSVRNSYVKMECSMRNSTSEISTDKCLQRQDSPEKKKAKDMKAKPSPLLVQHIESEEQVVSPHYKVMESPPTPETKTTKREFFVGRSVSPNSSSRSVSPKSSPDLDVYTYLSPVTSPDSDSSPPQPLSPSLFRTDSTDRDSKLAFCDSNSINSYVSPCTDSIPYSNGVYSRLPKTMDPVNESVHIVEFPQKEGNQKKGTSDKTVKPPISPRKSLRIVKDQTTSSNKCPIYENVEEFFALELLQNEKHRKSLCGKDSEKCATFEDILNLDKQPQEIAQYAEIFTYPVIGEFPGHFRSNSVPCMDAQQLSRTSPCLEHVLHQQPASRNHTQNSVGERTTGVKTKIQALEEVMKMVYFCITPRSQYLFT